MKNIKIAIPRVALLGVCQRARYDRRTPPELSSIDVLGLRKVILPYIYPFDATNQYLVLAVYGIELSDPGSVILRNSDGNQILSINISVLRESELTFSADKIAELPKSGFIIPVSDLSSWNMFLVPLNDLVLDKPQNLMVYLLDGQEEIPLGILEFGLASAPLLTPDRIAAIKSDPTVVKAAFLNLGCKHCESTLKVFTALEKPKQIEKDMVWYQDVQGYFNCSCGKTKYSLDILKTNMHTLLGRRDLLPNKLTFTASYEYRAIDQTLKELLELIGGNPKEEIIQQYLSKNPIVFHFLSPIRLFEKPPILSKYRADFAVLDSRGYLIFVEIERPDLRLIRKDGAISAEMTHAINQVQEWLFDYEQHRGAVLDCLALRDHEVTKARGIVIAGRDEGYDRESLRKFKWQDRGPIECMTYDDLLGKLASLNREMNAM